MSARKLVIRSAIAAALVSFGRAPLVCVGQQTNQPPRVTVILTNTPTVRTVALPPPERHAAAWEPAIAVDPNDASHIAVSAMYPSPAGPGSRRLWLWRSADQGRSWDGERVVADTFEGNPDVAADPVLGYAADGSVLLTSMAMGLPFGPKMMPGTGIVPGGIYVSRWNPRGPGLGRGMQIGPNGWDSVSRVRINNDKPAMVIDHAPRSPNHGSIYVTWAALTMVGTPDTLAAKGMLSYSRHGGTSFTSPRQVADSAFNLTMALGPTGVMDIVYANMIGKEAAGHYLQAIRSTDGGQSFGPSELITQLGGDTVLELPTIATHPNGNVLACWTEGPRHNGRLTRVRCRTKLGDGWQPPIDVGGVNLHRAVAGWPALVATSRGWSLLLYLSRAKETEVAVFRSPDGRRFAKLATLALARGLGSDRFCVRVIGPCPTDAFRIGHYVSLSTSGDHLVAAFVLPRSARVVGSGGVFVSVIDDAGSAALGDR